MSSFLFSRSRGQDARRQEFRRRLQLVQGTPRALRLVWYSLLIVLRLPTQVKYKKKRPPKNGQVKIDKSVPCTTASTMTTMKTESQDGSNASSISTLVNGTILKTALTNPSEVTPSRFRPVAFGKRCLTSVPPPARPTRCFQVIYLRQRLDNAVSSSRDRTFSIEATVNMIKNLVDCDEFQDIATLRVSGGRFDNINRAPSPH